MNTCTKCGNGIVPNSTFCVECGTHVEVSQPQPQPQPQAYPTQYGYQSQTPPYQYTYPQQKTEREPGRKMIYVVSILLTIFGSLGTLSSISSIFTASFMASIYPSSVMDSWFVVVITAAIASISMLAFGIGGIIMSKDPKKANTIMVFGVLLLIFIFANGISVFIMSNNIVAFIVDDVLGYFSNGFSEFMTIINSAVVVGAIIGIISNSILPTLLIIGAHKRKKNA